MNLGPQEYLAWLRRTEDLRAVKLSQEEIRRTFGDSYLHSILKEGSDEAKPIPYTHLAYNRICSSLPLADQQRLSSQVVFGELLLRGVNAEIRQAPGGYSGFVIIVNVGLTTLWYHLTKIILARTAVFPSMRDWGVTAEVLAEVEVVAQAVRQLFARYRVGQVAELPKGTMLLDRERYNLLSHLQWHSVSFVVAHEIGHFLCSHFASEREKRLEFEADLAAMAIVANLAITQGDDWELMYAVAGGLLTLKYIEMLESADASALASDTHPPAKERIQKIRQSFAFNDQIYGPGMSFLEFLEGIEPLVLRR